MPKYYIKGYRKETYRLKYIRKIGKTFAISLALVCALSTMVQASQKHVVKWGDTLFLIARSYYSSVSEIKEANNLTSNTIYPGQVLVIPTYTPPIGGGSDDVNTSGFSDSELYLFAQIVTAESEGEPYEGQVAVAATILNRMRSKDYPNTLYEVIYQVTDGKYYQYSPVLDGRINCTPSASAKRAVRAAISGLDPSYGATGFYNPSKTSNIWVRNRPVTRVIGNHTFFK